MDKKELWPNVANSDNDKIPPGNYDYNTIAGEWFSWYLSIPTTENPIANLGTYFQYANTFLFNKNNTLVYFVAVAPFQKPDFRRLIMTRRAALLVPVYKFHA